MQELIFQTTQHDCSYLLENRFTECLAALLLPAGLVGSLQNTLSTNYLQDM